LTLLMADDDLPGFDRLEPGAGQFAYHIIQPMREALMRSHGPVAVAELMVGKCLGGKYQEPARMENRRGGGEQRRKIAEIGHHISGGNEVERFAVLLFEALDRLPYIEIVIDLALEGVGEHVLRQVHPDD